MGEGGKTFEMEHFIFVSRIVVFPEIVRII